MGDYELCRDTLRLLLDSSEKFNGNGRIPHEVTTMGLCAHPGNTQETAHFISMVWLYYEWTGDRDFLDLAFPVLQKSVAWLRAQDDDNDGFPSGYGILEIPGLNSEMLDTAVYTAQAYTHFAALCRLKALNAQADGCQTLLNTQADECQTLSDRTVAAINTVMWDEEAGLYCDACTSSADVRSRYDAILGRRYGAGVDTGRQALDEALAKKAKLPPEAESGWLLNYGWTINTPMETGIATRDKALRALEQMHGDRFIGEYGMYLSGIFQDAAMTISTGVMAVAQARYGFADRALALLEKMFACFGHATPGCISEMLPDYGCFAQAWTIYAAQIPITRYFFGIQPSASQNRLRVVPCMPSAWPFAELRRLRVLDGELSLRYQRDGKDCCWHLEYTGSASVVFVVPEGYDNHASEIMMNDGRLDVSLKAQT
jgi:glycogen debranching enzyme